MCVCVYRAYGGTLQLSPDSANLWHDLAVGYSTLDRLIQAAVNCPMLPTVLQMQATDKGEGEKQHRFSTALNVSAQTVLLMCVNLGTKTGWHEKSTQLSTNCSFCLKMP